MARKIVCDGCDKEAGANSYEPPDGWYVVDRIEPFRMTMSGESEPTRHLCSTRCLIDFYSIAAVTT